MTAAREEILKSVRDALGRRPGAPVPPLPATARVGPRTAGALDAEIELLLSEIRKLSGVTRQLANPEDLRPALAELVAAEGVKRATVWSTPDLAAWGVPAMLTALGVALVSPQADKHAIAECELGVTGADGLFPETGTLLLHSDAERPRVVSLLPRVHLAITTPGRLMADLHSAFAAAKDASYSVLVTGPSRTADIELTLTLGVHGPKALYVWLLATP
ncbi:MAG TPA: LUD domain-containing protein [Candidatus Baltobacteraceae bacterium]|nr:LUD domain-containing protein [Candidatus Baltobacteraceae bacterium]